MLSAYALLDEKDLEECVTYLRFPQAHHRRIRTTNRLERLNGEGRRRTKVIPRFPTECSCLTLLYASLVAASKRWRGIPMTAAMRRQLAQLRAEAAPASKEAVCLRRNGGYGRLHAFTGRKGLDLRALVEDDQLGSLGYRDD